MNLHVCVIQIIQLCLGGALDLSLLHGIGSPPRFFTSGTDPLSFLAFTGTFLLTTKLVSIHIDLDTFPGQHSEPPSQFISYEENNKYQGLHGGLRSTLL